MKKKERKNRQTPSSHTRQSCSDQNGCFLLANPPQCHPPSNVVKLKTFFFLFLIVFPLSLVNLSLHTKLTLFSLSFIFWWRRFQREWRKKVLRQKGTKSPTHEHIKLCLQKCFFLLSRGGWEKLSLECAIKSTLLVWAGAAEDESEI